AQQDSSSPSAISAYFSRTTRRMSSFVFIVDSYILAEADTLIPPEFSPVVPHGSALFPRDGVSSAYQ
ncbi:MAG: hypothetical protein V1784_06005, partial [bacterium]